MKQKIFLLCLSIVALCQCLWSQQKKVYISPKGNDKNVGTIEKPFKTIYRALIFSNRFKGEGVSLQLRGGTYYLDKTIILDRTNMFPKTLEISAYRNEQVFISAGRLLKLEWKPYKNGIYQAIVPRGISFERLYINGALQVLARYPNQDSSVRILQGYAADAIAPDRVRKWKNPVGGYVQAIQANQWGSVHFRIAGVDNDLLKLDGGWQINRGQSMSKKYVFVEDIFEELDTTHEWYLDKNKSILYFYPPRNIEPNKAIVEVSNLKNSIELHGTVDKPIRGITLNKLHFVHNERSFMETREPLLRSDWAIYRGGALLLEGTENCKITDCDFNGIGGNAVVFSNYNRYDTVSGCLIANIGANAIILAGNPSAVRSPLFSYSAKPVPYNELDKRSGPLTNDYPQRCLITDNLIHDIGRIEKQVAGVDIDMASSITISHNSIYNTPRAGINIGDGCWGGDTLAYNDVFNTVLETGDNGAFNSWGRDRYWNANRHYTDSLVVVHPELILLDVQRPNVIHDNRFQCDHGWDIDLDDGSSNYNIYNNVCLSGGIKLREGFCRIVENNIMINNSFHPHVWFKNSGDIFEHNIVMEKYFPIDINYWGKRIDNNLFPDASALELSQRNGVDKHSVSGRALFANAAIGSYTVVANSPALNVGFKNFPMNEFGVQSPSLKKEALQPSFPLLQYNSEKRAGSAPVISFIGGKIKDVEGLGDRSAYGLPDETGVIILSIGSNTSLLSRSGLDNNDVIRSADGHSVKNSRELLDIIRSANGKSSIPVELMHNQVITKGVLLLK